MFWCAVQPNQICHWLLSRPHTNQFGDPPCRMRTSRTSVNLMSSKSWIKVKTDQKQDGIFHKPHDKWYNSLQTPNNQGPVIHCSLRICGWWRRMLIWESWAPPHSFFEQQTITNLLETVHNPSKQKNPRQKYTAGLLFVCFQKHLPTSQPGVFLQTEYFATWSNGNNSFVQILLYHADRKLWRRHCKPGFGEKKPLEYTHANFLFPPCDVGHAT